MWVAGSPAAEPSSAASQGENQQEAELEAEELGLQQGTLIRDAGVPSSVLILVPNSYPFSIFDEKF